MESHVSPGGAHGLGTLTCERPPQRRTPQRARWAGTAAWAGAVSWAGRRGVLCEKRGNAHRPGGRGLRTQPEEEPRPAGRSGSWKPRPSVCALPCTHGPGAGASLQAGSYLHFSPGKQGVR